MQGDLNMGIFTIVNLKPFVENESARPAQDNEVINFGYFSNPGPIPHPGARN